MADRDLVELVETAGNFGKVFRLQKLSPSSNVVDCDVPDAVLRDAGLPTRRERVSSDGPRYPKIGDADVWRAQIGKGEPWCYDTSARGAVKQAILRERPDG